MHFACLGKFRSPAYREALRATGDAILVEDSPYSSGAAVIETEVTAGETFWGSC
jgi:predicted NAD-dependent protein-ADP-ribosyltransferase YbiA (DUF1768 family)